MKTTIDIPELLYNKAKNRASERGLTIKHILISFLEKELMTPAEKTANQLTPWANRKLLPEFIRLQAAGAFRPKPAERDITELISEDREDRPL